MDKKVPPKKARQGREGFPVLLILVAGLVLAAVAWGIAEIYGVFIDEQQSVESPQSSEVPIDEPTDGAAPD